VRMSRIGIGCCAQMSAVSRTRFASCVFMDFVHILGQVRGPGRLGLGSQLRRGLTSWEDFIVSAGQVVRRFVALLAGNPCRRALGARLTLRGVRRRTSQRMAHCSERTATQEAS
jgi:hypothetical protein